MSRIKNTVIALIAVVMLLTLGSVNALGAETGTDISASSVLDVTVPTQIAITTDAEGNTHVPDNLEIKNNSAYMYVHLDSAALEPAAGWHFDAAGEDVFSYGPGTKGFALKLFDKTAAYDSTKSQYIYDLSDLSKIDTLASMKMKCDAYVPAQSKTGGNENIAEVVVTIHAEEAPLPTLAANNSWYKGSVDFSTITDITLANRYVPTGNEDESWDASADDNGSVMAYRTGTSVVLSNTSKSYDKIIANADSMLLFSPVSLVELAGVINNPEEGLASLQETPSALTAINNLNLLDTSSVQNMVGAFLADKVLTSLDLSTWDVSKVQDMTGTFAVCASLETLNVDNWDTSSLTSLFGTFGYCPKLTNLNVSGWKTDNVTNMHIAFFNDSSLTSMNLSSWNTSKVKDMCSVFDSCSKLTALNISNWDTSAVTNMDWMFHGCASLTNIDIGNWNVSAVTTMYGMFSGCSGLAQFNAPNWNTASVTSIDWMFDECSALESVDISKWDTSHVTSFSGVFDSSGIKTLDISGWDISGADNGGWGMFSNCKALGEITVGKNISGNVYFPTLSSVTFPGYDGNWYTSTGIAVGSYYVPKGVAETYYAVKPVISAPTLLPYDDWYKSTEAKSSITKITFQPRYNIFVDTRTPDETWDASVAQNGSIMARRYGTEIVISGNGAETIKMNANAYMMFKDFESLASIERADILDTSSVKNLCEAFANCSALTTVDVSKWDVGNVTDISCMFDFCSSLSSLDVSKWNTSNMQRIESAFQGCKELTLLDVSKWDTSKATNISWIFGGCEKLTTLDISNWNTQNVTNMGGVFANCKLLQTIDVSKWVTDNVTDMMGMFNGCSALTSLDLSNWNTGKVTKWDETYMPTFSACTSLAEIRLGNQFVFPATDTVTNTWHTKPKFPTPQATCIDGADGHWYTEDGTAYLPTEIPSGVAATYYAVKPVIPSPILASGTSWYKGSGDAARINVTSIKFQKEFDDSDTRTPDQTWDASAAQDGSIIARSYGTEVVVSGNGADTIKMNPDSSEMFAINFFGEYEEHALQNIINLDMLDASDVTNMYAIFANCNKVTSLDIANWDTSKVSNMGLMFYGCSSLTSLDVSKWDVSSVTKMPGMFSLCSSLNELDVSEWNVSNVTAFHQSGYYKNYGMFSGCRTLTSLDVSKWNISSATDIARMFYDCSGLTSLNLSGWNTVSVTDMSEMLVGCSLLEQFTIGEQFVIPVDNAPFSAPSSTYIPGADGNWYTSDGTAYAPADVPSGVAATYYAVNPAAAYTISGLVKTYNRANPVTYTLTDADGNTVKNGTLIEANTACTCHSDTTTTLSHIQPFTIENVPQGEYTLTINKIGHASFHVKELMVDSDVDLTACGDERANPIVVRVGDLNGDGLVNSDDTAMVQECLFQKGDEIKYPGADIDGNGVVNSNDTNYAASPNNVTSSLEDSIIHLSGYTLTAQVTSYNRANPVAYQLYRKNDDGTYAETPSYAGEIPAGSNCECHEDSTSTAGEHTQKFTISGIKPGVYALNVSKAVHLDYAITDIPISQNMDLTIETYQMIANMKMPAGDVNGNGSITASDSNIVTNTQNYNKLTSGAQNPEADINGDGRINVSDKNIVTAVYNYGASALEYSYNSRQEGKAILGRIKTDRWDTDVTYRLYRKKDNVIVYQGTAAKALSSGEDYEGYQTFRITNIQPDTYKLVLHKPNHIDVTLDYLVVSSSNNLNLRTDSRDEVNTIVMPIGDVNGDGVIGDDDQVMLQDSTNYNRLTVDAQNPECDLNHDGVINSDDLSLMLCYNGAYRRAYLYDLRCYTVSGTIESHNLDKAITYAIYDMGYDTSPIKRGTLIEADGYWAKDETIDKSIAYQQSFKLPFALKNGTYKMVISKEGHMDFTILNIVIEDDVFDFSVSLNPIKMVYGEGDNFDCTYDYAGGAIKGQVYSWNSALPVAYKLYAYNDASGDYATTAAYEGTAIEANADCDCGCTVTAGRHYQTFTIQGVAEGTYKLVISKDTHINYTIKGIEIYDNVDLTQSDYEPAKVFSLAAGDLDGNGCINSDDQSVLLDSSNYNRAASDAANPEADINGDGSINDADLNIIINSSNYNRFEAQFVFDMADAATAALDAVAVDAAVLGPEAIISPDGTITDVNGEVIPETGAEEVPANPEEPTAPGETGEAVTKPSTEEKTPSIEDKPQTEAQIPAESDGGTPSDENISEELEKPSEEEIASQSASEPAQTQASEAPAETQVLNYSAEEKLPTEDSLQTEDAGKERDENAGC